MRRFFLFLITSVLLAGPAGAAVIHLKDGSTLRGTIVSATARDLQLHTPDGMLTIANERIQRIDYAETGAPPAANPPAAPVPAQTASSRLSLYGRTPLEETRNYVSLGIGVAIPLSRVDFQSTGGGSDDNGDTGLMLSGQYLYRLSPRWWTGLNMEYFHRSPTGSQSLLPASHTDVFGHTVMILPTAKFSLVAAGPVRPYLLGGLGMNYTSTVIEATPRVGFGWSDTNSAETRTLVDDAHWGLASTLRFGIDFSMTDPVLFSVEFGWTRLANAVYDATPAGQDLGLTSVSGNQNIMSIMARWGWRF